MNGTVQATAALRPIPQPPVPTGALAELRRDILRCTRCPLHTSRRRACPGEGPERAPIMIVGEAPGFMEDRAGRPFVGRAGQLLTQLLAEAGLDRRRVYLSNTVRCLPPKVGGSAAPSPEAIRACRPFLDREFELVRPAIVVLAGNTPLQSLFTPRLRVGAVHGRAYYKDGRWLYPIYHPSYALRAGTVQEVTITDELRADLNNLMRLRIVHAATSRRPWRVTEVVEHLFTSAPVPHTPNAHSHATTWHVLDHFALPSVSGDTVTWDLKGLRPMFKTPSAIQELLSRWTGRPVRLTAVSESHGAVATIVDPPAPAQTASAAGAREAHPCP